jgi:hypothetical protein
MMYGAFSASFGVNESVAPKQMIERQLNASLITPLALTTVLSIPYHPLVLGVLLPLL